MRALGVLHDDVGLQRDLECVLAVRGGLFHHREGKRCGEDDGTDQAEHLTNSRVGTNCLSYSKERAVAAKALELPDFAAKIVSASVT